MSRLVSLLILVLATLLTASATAAQQPQPFTIPSATVQEWQGYALTWRSYDGGTRSATATLYGNTSRHDSDERPYTVGDRCENGLCIGHIVDLCDAVRCTPLDDCHMTGVCDP